MNSSRFEFFSQRPLRRLSSTAYLSAPMPRNGKTTFEDMQRFNFYQFSPILIVFPSLRLHSLLFSLKWVIATSIAPRHTLWRVNGLSSTSLPSSSFLSLSHPFLSPLFFSETELESTSFPSFIDFFAVVDRLTRGT